jgi:hypothetical protein
VADVTVDGIEGLFIVDTGNSGGIDMVKRWADAHQFPGERPSVDVVAKTGAGNDETRSTIFRLARSAFGPIQHDDRLVSIDDPPDPGIIAGLVGNEVFAHCAGIGFDIAKRMMAVEPPCDRPTAEAKAGWRLAKNEAPEFKGRPWIIEKLVPGGAATRAGLETGDRILSVGGVPAELDVSKVQAVIERPAGTKVTIAFDRKGERRQVVMVLERLLAPR